MKNSLLLLTVAIYLCLLYACANNKSVVLVHPEKVEGMPDCSECHADNTDVYGVMNHKALDFNKKHGFYASSTRQACTLCHQESFCVDCHAHKSELRPSEKYADSPLRLVPHRGSYLTQHKIDGRIDPTGCVKCHGRQNNARCASCHK